MYLAVCISAAKVTFQVVSSAGDWQECSQCACLPHSVCQCKSHALAIISRLASDSKDRTVCTGLETEDDSSACAGRPQLLRNSQICAVIQSCQIYRRISIKVHIGYIHIHTRLVSIERCCCLITGASQSRHSLQCQSIAVCSFTARCCDCHAVGRAFFEGCLNFQRCAVDLKFIIVCRACR